MRKSFILLASFLIGCSTTVPPTKVASKGVLVPDVVIKADNVNVEGTAPINEDPKVLTCTHLVNRIDTVNDENNYSTCAGLICAKGTAVCKKHHKCSCTLIGTGKK